MPLTLISAGAAKGVVEALADSLCSHLGATIEGTFGAVGAMKERLLAGAACDAIILTGTLLEALAREGHVERDSITPVGRVPTGLAVRGGDPTPTIADAGSLRECLAAATSVYVPDPTKATAGIHFMSVLERLSLRDSLAGRLRPYPNGAAAMAALADARDARPVGCTQVSEIRYTPGVSLVANLPAPFELVTLYSAAVASRAADRMLAQRFVTLLCGDATRALREAAGFST